MGNKQNNGNGGAINWTTIIAALIGAVATVLAALIAALFGLIDINHKGEYEFWTVTGHLCLNDRESFDNTDVIISIKPPDQELYRKGTFVIKKIPIKKGELIKPSLLIKKAGYDIAEVVLEHMPQNYYEIHGLPDYSISYDRANKIINIHDNIVLNRETNAEGGVQE